MKKTWKKVLAMLSVLAVMTSSLAACSTAGKQEPGTVSDLQSAAESTADAAAADGSVSGGEGEEIVLRFAWWGSETRHEATLKAIELYEAQNPNVKIEGEYQGYDGYYEKMMTMLSSGTAPDLMQFERGWLAEVQGAKHYLADLSKLPVDTSTLKEGLLSGSCTYNGEPLLFPATVGGRVAFINTEFAGKFGIDITRDYTWKELMEIGKEVHEKDPESYLMAADIDVINGLFMFSYLTQKTGRTLVDENTYELTYNEEQMTEALQTIVDLYESNTLEPFGESAVFTGQMEQNNRWLNGKIGILLDTTGACDKYTAAMPDKLDVMMLPSQDDAVCSGVSYGGGIGFVVNDNSQYKEETAKFLDFLMNDQEAIEALGTCRGYCSTDKAEEILSAEGLLNELQIKAIALSQRNNPYMDNSISSNKELTVIRKDVVQEVIYGDVTPEQGAKEIIEESSRILKALKEEQ